MKPEASGPGSASNADGRRAEASSEFVFSNLSYALQRDKKETKRDKRNKFMGRDYRRLLEKATRRGEKLESLRERNEAKAEVVLNSIAWERAFCRATGQKVKDDLNLLKKGLKRKVKIKERRKQKWDERKQAVDHRMEKRQQKRRENIDKRRETKRKRKMARRK